jgi:hypothetical protein
MPAMAGIFLCLSQGFKGKVYKYLSVIVKLQKNVLKYLDNKANSRIIRRITNSFNKVGEQCLKLSGKKLWQKA